MATRKMRTFEGGATRDSDHDKPDYEGYLSPSVIKRFGQYMLKHQQQADGSIRASDNWQCGQGIPQDAYIKSAFRHFMDWWRGHRTDGITDLGDFEDSMCALMFNAMGYLHEHLKAQPVQCEHQTDCENHPSCRGVCESHPVADDECDEFEPDELKPIDEPAVTHVGDLAILPVLFRAYGDGKISADELRGAINDLEWAVKNQTNALSLIPNEGDLLSFAVWSLLPHGDGFWSGLYKKVCWRDGQGG